MNDVSVSFLDPVEQGSTLTEKAVDVHLIDGQEVIARWYHSPHESDLMLWFENDGTISRFQLNCSGQIVDWNRAEGLQTGLIIEFEIGREVAETIQFDVAVNLATIEVAGKILVHCGSLAPTVRDFMLTSLLNPPLKNSTKPRANSSRARFWGRFKRWTAGA